MSTSASFERGISVREKAITLGVVKEDVVSLSAVCGGIWIEYDTLKVYILKLVVIWSRSDVFLHFTIEVRKRFLHSLRALFLPDPPRRFCDHRQ